MSLFNVQINFVKAEWADNFLDRVSLVIAKAFGQNIEVSLIIDHFLLRNREHFEICK